MSNKFKIVLIGDAGVGKTTFITRHRTGEFLKNYIATVGVEVNPLIFYTTAGNVTLNIWDCAGQEKFGGQSSGYWEGADACIVMFDLTSKVSYRNAKIWHDKFMKEMGSRSVPVVFCGNKIDCQDRKVQDREISFEGAKYCSISSLSGFNVNVPFIYLMRSLMKDETLSLIGSDERQVEVIDKAIIQGKIDDLNSKLLECQRLLLEISKRV